LAVRALRVGTMSLPVGLRRFGSLEGPSTEARQHADDRAINLAAAYTHKRLREKMAAVLYEARGSRSVEGRRLMGDSDS
jgi:hypothetical protein